MRGRYVRILGAGILLLGIAGLAQAQLVIEVGKGDGQPNYQLCNFDTFGEPNPARMTKFFADPFQVRQVKGVITSQGGPWPEGVAVRFEIRAKSGGSTVYHAIPNAKGEYEMADLPAGEYCFRAVAKNWQTVCGMVVVSNKAPRNAKLSFEMPLDQ